MTIDSDFYVHPSDKAALDALKAIPGFTALLKAFMQVWNEQRARIYNMATNLRIDEKQLPNYYYMLPPICEKLGISVPELYLELNPEANAYTSGDTKPYIVITSGLLETLPDELIPTVLAHECGHIACHHVLYKTMGRMILSGSLKLLSADIASIALTPIQIAFSYWMRCSEYSADRAAILCDDTSDNIVEMCMRFAGFDKDIHEETNTDAFLQQAIEYKKLLSESKVNQALEFVMFKNSSHPLNSIRAYEGSEWEHSQEYVKIKKYLQFESDYEIPVKLSAKQMVGKSYVSVAEELRKVGITDIQIQREKQKQAFSTKGKVLEVEIGGKKDFGACTWFSPDITATIKYYEPETEEELVAAHPNQVRTPESSKHYTGKPFQQVVLDFQNAGFFNVDIEAQKVPKKTWLSKDGLVSAIHIGTETAFEKGVWFSKDSKVTVTYQVFVIQAKEK